MAVFSAFFSASLSDSQSLNWISLCCATCAREETETGGGAGDLVRPFSNLRKWPGRTEELLITFFRLSLARFRLPPSKLHQKGGA